MENKDILIRQIDPSEARVVFVYPHDKDFINMMKAMRLRGLVELMDNPIPVKNRPYKAWVADMVKLDEETYGQYKNLVADFYSTETREKFNRLFVDVRPDKVIGTVHNPNKYLEANRGAVESLVERYRNTTSPLEFYGSNHQAEGVVLLRQAGQIKDGRRGAMITDECGLGKTRQVVVAAVEEKKKNILVVTTKSAKRGAWPREIRLVDPKASIFLADHNDWQRRARWTIMHWSSLREMPEEFFLNANTYDLIVLDEIHYLVTTESQRTQATFRLCEDSETIWGLSGTPMTKYPKSLVNPLKIIRHPLVSTEQKVWAFMTRYCGEKNEYTGYWDWSKAKNLDELHLLLRDACIRREASSTNLPPLILEANPVSLDDEQREFYDTCWDRYLAKPGNLERSQKPGFPDKMVLQTLRRKAVSMAKVPMGIEKVQELLDAGEKVVVFTPFTDVFNAYSEAFKGKAVGINGKTKEEDIDGIIQKFQTDPKTTVFVGNLQKCKEGITLTAARYIIIHDLSWLPTDIQQAIKRVHRGSATKTCFGIFLLAEDTTDEKMYRDYLKYSEIVNKVVSRRDGDDPPPATEEEQTEREEQKQAKLDAPEKPKRKNHKPIVCGNEGMKDMWDLRDEGRLTIRDTMTVDSMSAWVADNGGMTQKQLDLVKILARKYGR